MEKYICKIKAKNNQGTGFFTKIPFPTKDNMLTALMTNNHVINEEVLSYMTIKQKVIKHSIKF